MANQGHRRDYNKPVTVYCVCGLGAEEGRGWPNTPCPGAAGEELARLRAQFRAIELAVDGLNTKAFKQKPETQAVLDRIKATAREAQK